LAGEEMGRLLGGQGNVILLRYAVGSASTEAREAGFLAYGDNFWDNRHQTATSLDSITRDDLVAFHKKWFWPGNFIVAVNGDFDRDMMLKKLETLFADWPWTGTPPPHTTSSA
jgi:predicted Zn-dependent peptidase